MLSTRAGRGSAWAVIGALVATLVVGLIWTQTQMTERTKAIRAAQESSTASLRVIKDCTRPQGQCFERGQRQTGQAVATINEVSIIAAACADDPARQTVEQIRVCVAAELKRARPSLIDRDR